MPKDSLKEVWILFIFQKVLTIVSLQTQSLRDPSPPLPSPNWEEKLQSYCLTKKLDRAIYCLSAELFYSNRRHIGRTQSDLFL